MTAQGIATSDFNRLHELKALATQDSSNALPEVAKQFEAIFLQSMLKSMRMGQHFLDDASPFKGKDQDTYQEMLDGQYASSISNSQGIGLAAMLAKQLSGIVKPNDQAPQTQTTESPLNKPTPNIASSEPRPSGSGKVENEKAESGNPSTGIDDFIKSIWPTAKQAASMLGLDPKILIAQAALETGWGKHIAQDADGSTSNNLFNIKSGHNKEHDSVTVQTTEYIANTPIKMNASFRKYANVEQSFNDYISFIKGNDRYQNAIANVANPELYVRELHKAGYATDPQYSSKILSIYHGNELNQAIERCGFGDAV